jgi:large subunit ribosomal protein L24
MRRKTNTIPKLHVKKNDTVKILSGNDKGKTGRVLEVIPKERKAIIEGINMVTKHSKVTAQNPNGGRVKEAAAMYVSKLMVVEPKTGVPTRIGRDHDDKGKLVRISKKTGEKI